MIDFIFETSGTTGKPKRVLWSEAAFIEMGKVDAADLNINHKSIINIDRWSMGGFRKLYWARASGARLAIYPGHETISLRTWINQEQITHLSLLATTFRWVAQGIYQYPSVEVLEVGGEMVDWGDVELGRRVCPNAVFVNRYACSEANIICRKIVTGDQPIGEGRLPVGQPVAGVEVSLVAKQIVVKSPYMAEGYYNDPELTERKFVDGWYFSDDTGHWLPSGELMHDGRVP